MSSKKFLLYTIPAALLNFDGNQKCLVCEMLNSPYFRLYHVLSGDVLCEIGTILVGSRTSDVKTT